jgi:hypothetical protein
LDSKPARAKITALKTISIAGCAVVLVGALLFFLFNTTSGGVGGECCGNAPAGFKSYTTFPIDAGNPVDNNKCTKSRLQVAGGMRPLCALTNTTGYANNPCIVTALKNAGCACYEGQAHACDPDGGGPCTSGTNCGVRACIVTSDTSSTWSACTCM